MMDRANVPAASSTGRRSAGNRSDAVIARLWPGDPVRRGLSVYLERLWNTGSAAFAG